MSLKLNAAQERQFRILDQSINSGRDSNGSRGKAPGRGRGRGGRITTTRSQDNSRIVAMARNVAKDLFPGYSLRRPENESIWSIGDIDQVRGLAQISVKQNRVDVDRHVDRLHGTIFDYRERKIVALNLGSIPRAVADEKLDIDQENGRANFVIDGKSVTYEFDPKDGLTIETGFEGILCVLYKHGEDYLISNRTRINLGNGYVGESRRYSEMLETLIPEPGNWFQGLPDTTVFYFMLVAGDLLVGSRQYVPEDLEYIVYLGKRDMANLSELSSEIPPWLTSPDNANPIVNSCIYPRIQRPDIFPVQRFSIDAANDFLINGYEGQQRAAKSGWLNQPENGPSKPYIRLFPSTIVSYFSTDNIPQIARTIFDRFIDKSTISSTELRRFDEFLSSKNMTGNDQGIAEAHVDPIMIDMEHMPEWPGYVREYDDPTLSMLHKFVCAADMASMETIDEICDDITDVDPILRNSESVVVYMRSTKSGTPRYSLVHVFSAGMHYRQSIFEESQNRLLTSYLSLYQKICYDKIKLPRDFYVDATDDENYRFDVLTMDEARNTIPPSLLAKIVIRDSLPEGRQRIRIEEFDNSIISSVESFIVARSRSIVQELRATPLKNNSNPEIMERRIGGLVATCRRNRSALSTELSSMNFLDVIELYRYINSIYLNFKSEVL